MTLKYFILFQQCNATQTWNTAALLVDVQLHVLILMLLHPVDYQTLKDVNVKEDSFLVVLSVYQSQNVDVVDHKESTIRYVQKYTFISIIKEIFGSLFSIGLE